jgi:hypothetical protein
MRVIAVRLSGSVQKPPPRCTFQQVMSPKHISPLLPSSVIHCAERIEAAVDRWRLKEVVALWSQKLSAVQKNESC